MSSTQSHTRSAKEYSTTRSQRSRREAAKGGQSKRKKGWKQWKGKQEFRSEPRSWVRKEGKESRTRCALVRLMVAREKQTG